MARVTQRAVPFRRRASSLTSLIDVIFLLLLFFMLSTTFTRTAELPLIAAGSGTTMAKTAPVFLRLAADDLSVNGQPSGLDEVARRVVELAGDQAQVIVSLAPQVNAQRLADLLGVLRGLSGLRVQVLG